jgi:hypothetical protein
MDEPNIRFEVPMELKIHVAGFWKMTSSGLVGEYQRFGGT